MSQKEKQARRALQTGAGLILLGIALVGTGPSEVGGVLVVLALIVLLYAIHSFGRLGPDERPV